MLLLATEIWRSHGGIQRYMDMLTQILENRGEPFTSLTLLDNKSDRPQAAISFSVVSCGGNKIQFCWRALRLALRTRPRVAIVGHVGLLPVAWMLKIFGAIERYAVVLHGIEAWRRLPWLSRISAQGASVVVATTHYTAGEYRFHNRLGNASAVIIPLGCSFHTVAPPTRIIGAVLKILTVTRLSSADAYKGVDTVLHAIRRGRDLGVNLTLDLIGEGNDRRRLEDMARSLQIHDRVRFLGSLTDHHLATALGESHVFVMPSKKEGFGIVYLEAMATGLPCIGANHGGTPEVIEHGESGFLIEYGDVDQLVFYLKALLESRPLYNAMSMGARSRATETLTLQAMTESWHRLLDRLENGLPAESAAAEPESAKLPGVVS